jgi:anti-sigma B factor antagonist
MEINVRSVQGITVIELAGELTWKSAPEAQGRILAAAPEGGRVVLDMSRVSYMSSAGLRLLLMVYRTVTGKGGHPLLVGLTPDVKNTMSHTGFLDFFAYRDNLDDGVAALASGKDTHGTD